MNLNPVLRLESVGRDAQVMWEQVVALLSFVGEITLAMLGWLAHPQRIRWRPVLFNLRTAGLDAVPIVGLLSFLLGIVVAYQGADQLRQYGAKILRRRAGYWRGGNCTVRPPLPANRLKVAWPQRTSRYKRC